MKEKRSFSIGRWIGFLCCALLPVAAMGFGIALLMRGVQFNFRFVVTYVLLPTIGLGLFAWCIFSKCRAWLKGILCGGILCLFVVAFIFFFTVMGFVRVRSYEGAEAKEKYATAKIDNPLLPELSEIPSSARIEYHNVVDAFLAFFIAETDYLICSYTPEEYEAQKIKLDTEYTFQTQAVTLEETTCEPVVERDGYIFRMLSFSAYKEILYYPKRLIMIGYSDYNKEIVYVVFEDGEMDYISSLEEFIDEDCGWRYIR